MPRASLAEKYYEDSEDHEDDSGEWIIVYDFEGKPNSKFWTNMHRLSERSMGSRFLQFSVFTTASRRVARAAVMLTRHYGGAVETFRVDPLDP